MRYLPPPTQLLTYGNEKLALIKIKISNPFYIDIVEALIQFNKYYNPSKDELLTEMIWFSDHCGFPKGIVKKWDKQGLRFINDLYNPVNRRLYLKNELEDKFKINMTFLCYERLTQKLCKNAMRETKNTIENPNIPFKIQAVLSGKKFTKQVYNIFTEAISTSNTKTDQRKIEKWEADVGEYVSGTSAKLMKITKSTKLFYLHYRIISRIFATNKLLFVMKLKDSNKCTFCQRETETLAHLFWYCSKVQRFVSELITHMKQKYKKVIHINISNWFFLTELSNIDALIITISKYVIHRSRMNNTTPSIAAVVSALKIEAEKEYNMYKHVNKI